MHMVIRCQGFLLGVMQMIYCYNQARCCLLTKGLAIEWRSPRFEFCKKENCFMGKLGMGVLGVGEMGRRHAENIRRLVPQAQLVAIADVDADRAKQVAGELEIE